MDHQLRPMSRKWRCSRNPLSHPRIRDTLNKSGEGFSGSCRGISGKSPSFRNRFPGCSALPFRPGGAVAGFDRPVWPPASGFGHNCAYVSRSVDSPPSAGCPVQKAAPDAPCSSPAPGSAPPLSRGQALGVAEYPLHLQERVLHPRSQSGAGSWP